MYIGASTRPARTTPKARLARTPVTNHGSRMELGMDRSCSLRLQLQCDCATSVLPPCRPRDGHFFPVARCCISRRPRGFLIGSASRNLPTSSRGFAGNGSRSVRATYFRTVGCKGVNVIQGLLAPVTSSLVYGSAHLIRERPRPLSLKTEHRAQRADQRRLRRYRQSIAPDVTPPTPLSVTVPRTGAPASQGRAELSPSG